ncbi:MAG: hypothetical protein U0S50_11390 [Sphingopyxis sp.]|uniref:hypothetical protein n=1 Tax=Sphingopyxis sp. TaxID=1908224 RepID=UPI002ABC85A3|nr:hypothetical protein [Sphingopyxis sp.]MDZ3832410.1 hypothetical protein [Sphingopyxis sp.]
MRITGNRAAMGAAGIAMAGLSSFALASGSVPVMQPPQDFETHQACVAALEDLAADDRRQVAPLSIDADGNRREVTLSTKGIERTGETTARYDATLWYQHGRPRPDLQRIETSHSYAHRLRECSGATMTTTGRDGYTLGTFDPIDAPEPKP